MRRHKLVKTMVAAGLATLWGGWANADGGSNSEDFTAHLTGFQEVGALNNETGAILTNGTGTLQLHLDRKAKMATFKLTFSDLSSSVTQAHIHFGKVHVPGGIFVFFCTNLGNGPAGTQTCPSTGGTVTGTITAANIIAPTTPTNQGITAGNFDVLVEALGAHAAYANIHTTNFPAGEIRGQIHPEEGDHR